MKDCQHQTGGVVHHLNTTRHYVEFKSPGITAKALLKMHTISDWKKSALIGNLFDVLESASHPHLKSPGLFAAPTQPLPKFTR